MGNELDIINVFSRIAAAGLAIRLSGPDSIEVSGGRMAKDLRRDILRHKPTLMGCLSRLPEVVNSYHLDFDWEEDPAYVYIGRGTRDGLSRSPFANPFPARKNGGRDRAVQLYRRHLAFHPEIIGRALATLGGKKLVCTCAPKPCHGDVLVELFEVGGYEQEERLAIQTEHIPELGESIPELIRWFERRDRWREAEAQGLLAGRMLAGYDKRIAPGVATEGDSNPNPYDGRA